MLCQSLRPRCLPTDEGGGNVDQHRRNRRDEHTGQRGTPPTATIGVVLAGGVGTRMGLDIPKQLVPVAGRTSLEHTVDVFQQCPSIDEIIVVMDPGSMDRAEKLVTREKFPNLSGLQPGGHDRNETSYLALREIATPGSKVIFHDAVRPLVDPAIIRTCVDALDTYDAVDTAIPSADTIIEVDEHDIIRAVPPRASLRRLAQLLAEIGRSGVRPDALIFTGDLTDIGDPRAYEALRGVVEPFAEALGAPVIWLMGNHDRRGRPCARRCRRAA